MNQNDMDRYYWRAGQRWSGDNRRVENITLLGRTVAHLFLAFVITSAMLYCLR